MKRIVVAAKAGADQPWLADAAANLAEELGAEVAVVSLDGIELEALLHRPPRGARARRRGGGDARWPSGSARPGSRRRAAHRSGPVVRGVLVFAEEQEADLIVVGATSRGRGRAPHARHGDDAARRALAPPRPRHHPAAGMTTTPQPDRQRRLRHQARRRARRRRPRSEAHQLKRSVGLLDLSALGLGAIIGTGIFVILGEAIGDAGPAIVLSFVLAGLTCAFSALSYAELASTIPVAGLAPTRTRTRRWAS